MSEALFVRTLLVSAVAVALFSCGHAVARSAHPDTATGAASLAADPFLGTWELDLTRMPDSYGPPPKRVTFTFDNFGSGAWRTRVEIIAPDDSVRQMAVQYRRDGQAVAGEGDNVEGESVAVHSPAPNVLVFSMAKDKKLNGTRTYAVSPDGQEMTESAANVDATGVPFVRNFHFKRIR